jgi:hypothetical protein
MNPERKKRLFELFAGHAADTLTPEKHTELQAALRTDAEARRLWFVHQDIEMGLRTHHAAEPAERAESMTVVRWLSWRPLTAAAAGLMVGLLGAGLVWAKVSPRPAMAIPLLTESFEDAAMARDRGFPNRINVWSGDLSAPGVAADGVQPKDGGRMMILQPDPRRKFSYAMRFIELAPEAEATPTGSRQVEAIVSFHGGATNSADRYQMHLAAFADGPAEAKAIWHGNNLDEEALQRVSKAVTVGPSMAGWQTFRVTMDVPVGTRLVLISLAAAVADSDAPKTPHYLDDVQVRLISQPVLR